MRRRCEFSGFLYREGEDAIKTARKSVPLLESMRAFGELAESMAKETEGTSGLAAQTRGRPWQVTLRTAKDSSNLEDIQWIAGPHMIMSLNSPLQRRRIFLGSTVD